VVATAANHLRALVQRVEVADKEVSHHGIEVGTAAHPRRRFKREIRRKLAFAVLF
jgi:hypothetical protein